MNIYKYIITRAEKINSLWSEREMCNWKSVILNENAPLVSVVIPTYKRKITYLARAVNSVREQTYQNIEIIVIDDSPADYEFRNDIKEYMLSICSDNIHYYQNEKNIGGSLARNRGIDLAKGEFVTFLDDDDEYIKDKVESQVKFMIAGGYDLSFSNMIMYNSNGKVVDYREYKDIPSFKNKALLHYHLMKHMTGTPTFMFCTQKLREIDGFENVKVGQEFYLMLKSIERNLKIGYLPECHVKVYRHSDGCISQGRNKIEGEQYLFEFKKKYFSELSNREIRFIKFRHWAVMAIAYKRDHIYGNMLISGMKAIISSPIDFALQFYGFINRIYKNNKLYCN